MYIEGMSWEEYIRQRRDTELHAETILSMMGPTDTQEVRRLAQRLVALWVAWVRQHGT